MNTFERSFQKKMPNPVPNNTVIDEVHQIDKEILKEKEKSQLVPIARP